MANEIWGDEPDGEAVWGMGPDGSVDDDAIDLETKILFPGQTRTQLIRASAYQGKLVQVRARSLHLDLTDLSDEEFMLIELANEPEADENSEAVQIARRNGYYIATLIWYLASANSLKAQYPNLKLTQISLWQEWLIEHIASLRQLWDAPVDKYGVPIRAKSYVSKFVMPIGFPKKKKYYTWDNAPKWLRLPLDRLILTDDTLRALRERYLPVAHIWASILNHDGSERRDWRMPSGFHETMARSHLYRQLMQEKKLYPVALGTKSPDILDVEYIRRINQNFQKYLSVNEQIKISIEYIELGDNFVKRQVNIHNKRLVIR